MAKKKIDNFFEVPLMALRAYTDEDGNIYIQGLGGDTEPDYDHKVDKIEKLTLAAIKDLVGQVARTSIPLLPSHWERGGNVVPRTPEWDDELGTTVSLLVNPDGQMFPTIKLDMDNQRSVTLYNKIKSGKKFALSWGGLVKEWHTEFSDDGVEILVIDRLELFHFAVTTRPVNTRALNYPLAIITKSVKWDTAERIPTDETIKIVDYPGRGEILELFQSTREEVFAGYKGNKQRNDLEVTDTMNEEQIKALMEAALKAALGPLYLEITALKTSIAAVVPNAVKSEPGMSATEIAKVVTETVAIELKARDGELEAQKVLEAASLKSKKEIDDLVQEKVNKALENLSNGLKSKPGAGGEPGGEKGNETQLALKSIMSGEKTIDDFSPAVQRVLEDFSAGAFAQIEAKMPKV